MEETFASSSFHIFPPLFPPTVIPAQERERNKIAEKMRRETRKLAFFSHFSPLHFLYLWEIRAECEPLSHQLPSKKIKEV